jgi:hypothetical protein
MNIDTTIFSGIATLLTVVHTLASAQPPQTPSAPLSLDCSTPESVAMRAAPLGATRTSKNELTVVSRAGTHVFRNEEVEEGMLGGVSYLYCGYDVLSGFHFIQKNDKDALTGLLLANSSGQQLPAGQRVIFAANRRSYFSTVQPDGLDGEEWHLYSISGKALWKGLSGISAKHPKLNYEYFVATLQAPRWSATGELQATLICESDRKTNAVVTLRPKGRGYAWVPSVACPPN